MKLKDVASIKIGLSNKLSEGDQEFNIFDLKSFRDNSDNTKSISLSDDLIQKNSINENMILIPQMNLEFDKIVKGKYFKNWLLGKNIYAIEFSDVEYLDSFYYLLKNAQINIPTQGLTIKQINRNDLLEVEFEKLKPETLKVLKNLDKTIYKQEETVKLLKRYQKAIIQKINK